MTRHAWRVAAVVVTSALVALTWARAMSGTLFATAHAEASYMETARTHVTAALGELQRVSPTADGHRERAIEACTAAVQEIDKGIAHLE